VAKLLSHLFSAGVVAEPRVVPACASACTAGICSTATAAMRFHGHAGHAAHGTRGRIRRHVPVQLRTITAFLAWFGGAGYLLTRFGGFVGASALLLSLRRAWREPRSCLVHGQGALVASGKFNPDDYDPIGLIGIVNSSIREGGTEKFCFHKPARDVPPAHAARPGTRFPGRRSRDHAAQERVGLRPAVGGAFGRARPRRDGETLRPRGGEPRG
jgi:hypothetical protein